MSRVACRHTRVRRAADGRDGVEPRIMRCGRLICHRVPKMSAAAGGIIVTQFRLTRYRLFVEEADDEVSAISTAYRCMYLSGEDIRAIIIFRLASARYFLFNDHGR